MINVGIIGFGRIGRSIFRLISDEKKIKVKLISDLYDDIDNLIYLIKNDTTYGQFKREIKPKDKKKLLLEKKIIHYFTNKEINENKLKKLHLDVLIISNGISSVIDNFVSFQKKGLVKKIIITNSTDKCEKEIVMGVNDANNLKKYNIFSSSICDANAISHLLNILEKNNLCKNGSVTTIHPWLSYQNLVDSFSISQTNPNFNWTNYALGRSSIDNIIPKDTTAIDAVDKILPGIRSKFLSFSYRVPNSIVASSDLTINLNKKVSSKHLKNLMENEFKNSKYVKLNYEPLVSLDYKESKYSAIIDMQWIKVKNNTAKFVIWYDNEIGYSMNVINLIKKIF
tara:strand:- start:2984 stop:4003 length:1020 start_codon:yes stop_codon:yes gene_type:complete